MTAKLDKLYLDIPAIEPAIKSFNQSADVKGPTKKGGANAYEITVTGEKKATLHIFIRQDGTVTLHPNVGQNQALSNQIALHVKEKTEKVQYKPRTLSLAAITEKDWDFLIEHLSNDWEYRVTEETLAHAKRYKVELSPSDYVFLHRYTTGRFLMQGVARDVHNVVTVTLCELLPDKISIIDAQIQVFEIKGIKSQDLLQEVSEKVPSAIGIIGDTGKAILAPSLALSKIDIDLPDYSCFVYPALRGLEAYMKSLMAKHGMAVHNKVGFSDFFNGSVLKSGVRDRINCTHTVKALEKSCTFFNTHRHGLFHTDANPETSRVIQNKAEAESITNDVFHLIESTSCNIPK